jgi:hypothetical protein
VAVVPETRYAAVEGGGQVAYQAGLPRVWLTV